MASRGRCFPALPRQSVRRLALDAVYDRLNTRNGIKLSTPGYDGYDPSKGGVTTYPPGAKENGGIFLHANPWVMIAETMLGNGDRAFEYYDQINPAAKNDNIDEFECEPYVYPQNILGDEHPQFGLARNSWLRAPPPGPTRPAPVHPGHPANLRGPAHRSLHPGRVGCFKVTREFRGATYQIEAKPERVSKGVKSMRVNGQAIQGNIVPILAPAGRTRCSRDGLTGQGQHDCTAAGLKNGRSRSPWSPGRTTQ